MVSTSALRLALVFPIVALYTLIVACNALVITAPTWDSFGSSTRNQKSNAGTKIERLDLSVKIRSTSEADIQEIASMLAYSIVNDNDTRDHVSTLGTKNFFPSLNLDVRNTRNSIVSLLQSRMNAITIGRKFMRDHLAKGTLEGLSEADQLRFLWSNDAFRKNIEKAALLSNEPHIWSDHNFVCAPQSFDWLFHKMVTAENALTGEIIGFCEVAMLSKPSERDSQVSRTIGDEECSIVDENNGVPTIMNLVTSPNYRRRGVASTIVGSAMRYIQTTAPSSSGDEIALYVEERNSRAISMYERLGFERQERLLSKDQLYMTRQLSSGAHEVQPMSKVEIFQ